MSLSFERREELLDQVGQFHAQASAGTPRGGPEVIRAAHELVDNFAETVARTPARPRRAYSMNDLGPKAPLAAREIWVAEHERYEAELDARGGRVELGMPRPAPASSAPPERRYENMSGHELAEIEHSDAAAFNALRGDWLERGQPDFDPKPAPMAGARASNGRTYEQLSGPEAAELEQGDPAAFARLRADWVKRGEPPFGGVDG